MEGYKIKIYEKLLNIQSELKAPKGQYNSFGKYKYRSCEDILEAVKPLCKKYGATLVLSDELKNIGERYYIQAEARLIDIEDGTHIQNTAYAREEQEKKGMDGSQITGTASSYARKYALNGLFNIDDTKDADTDEFKQQEEGNDIISGKFLTSLNEAIQKANIDDTVVELILSSYGYSSTSEIKMKDYISICNDFKKKKGEN